MNTDKFPTGRLIWATFMGGAATAGGAQTQNYWAAFALGALIQFFFSLIPVCIAYSRDCKHKNAIYNMGTILPATILVIAAIIWAIFDKKETNKSKTSETERQTILTKAQPAQSTQVKKKNFSGSAKVGSAW